MFQIFGQVKQRLPLQRLRRAPVARAVFREQYDPRRIERNIGLSPQEIDLLLFFQFRIDRNQTVRLGPLVRDIVGEQNARQFRRKALVYHAWPEQGAVDFRKAAAHLTRKQAL